MFKKEEDIKVENDQRINIFLDDLAKVIEEKNFKFRDLLLTYFEVLYRFKKDIPSEFVDTIFQESNIEESFTNFSIPDLIKLSYILSRHRLFMKTKEEAEGGLMIIANLILNYGLENLSKHELYELIYNISFNQLFTNLEFFTYMEPHLLKYFNEFSPKNLVNIYCIYIKNFLGSNFFIQTLGFTIASNFPHLSLKGKYIFKY